MIALLLSLSCLAPQETDPLAAELGMARSLAVLGAVDLARLRYGSLLRSRKTVRTDGTLDAAVVESEPRLLQAYYELGNLSLRCAKAHRQELRFDDAATVYSNILRIVPFDDALWWKSQYGILEVLYERGAIPAARPHRPVTEQERGSPVYDSGRFGMKTKFEVLMEKIRKQQAGGKE